jgi:hypothetical protein
MTRKRKKASVSESPNVSDEQPETSQESPKSTPTSEATSSQYTNEAQNTSQEPKHLSWLCEEHAEIVSAERLRSNNDVFAPLRDSTAQIRLLQLDTKSTIGHITASLQTWERSSLPEFNAISYVCGKALPQNAVCINGCKFYVGNNCFYALSQVCLHYPGSYVWIDAICINQQDLAEKSAQVSAMGGIYKLSLRVLACIGPSDAASDKVLRATKDINSFVQDPPEEWDEASAFRTPRLWKPPYWNPPMDESSTLELWEDFTEFERRPYFHRAWIVQELVGGKGRTTILCGQSQICWTALCTLADRLCKISESDHAPYNLVETRYADRVVYDLDELTTTSESGEFTFPRYMEQMAEKDCQDPRDRFFGTMDLVDWQRLGQTRPIPDYHITPLELAFNLLQRTVDPMLDDVFFISRSLGLHYKSQPCSDIERKRSQYNARRGYVSPLSGVHIVEQGADGRLNVGLHHADSRNTHSVPQYFDGIEHDPTFLNEHKVVQLFTGDNPSVLASVGVRAGDLLVDGHQGSYCDIVKTRRVSWWSELRC